MEWDRWYGHADTPDTMTSRFHVAGGIKAHSSNFPVRSCLTWLTPLRAIITFSSLTSLNQASGAAQVSQAHSRLRAFFLLFLRPKCYSLRCSRRWPLSFMNVTTQMSPPERCSMITSGPPPSALASLWNHLALKTVIVFSSVCLLLLKQKHHFEQRPWRMTSGVCWTWKLHV